MKYEINIIYKGQVNYIVEAEDEESAKDIAEIQYKDGVPAIDLCTEWEEIENIVSKPISDD